jgi:hypothetical protein
MVRHRLLSIKPLSFATRLLAFFLAFQTSAPLVAQPDPAAAKDLLLERLASRAAKRQDRTLDILVLSGGGQHGAWGVGFLRGWRKHPTNPAPRFDLVTGISTGSLIAPYALLGTDQAMDEVTDLYRNAVDQIRPSLDPLFWVKRSGALMNRKKLESTIERVVNGRLANNLREEFAEDRQLMVGTANLETGLGQIWSIGTELNRTSQQGSAAVVERYQKILLAASAIPGVFAPVSLDGAPHVDGGVVANLLLGLDLKDFRTLADKVRQRGITDPLRVRLWVIVNLWVYPVAKPANTRTPQAVRDRTGGMQLILKQQQTLTRFWELSEAVSSGVPGLQMQVRHTMVPAKFAYQPGASKLFDQPYMNDLERAGYERARSASPWDALPLDPFAPPH